MMTANEIEIATANTIILDYGKENFLKIDVFIWQLETKKYNRIRPNTPISEFSPEIIAELVHRLFMVKAVKDFSVHYEYPNDNTKGMPKKTAYLYLKELEE